MNFKIKLLTVLVIALLMVGVGFNRSFRDVQTFPLHISTSLIHFYKKHISVAGSPACVFYPSCSLYSKEALEKHGLMRGWAMSFDRLTRCNNEMWIYPEILVEDEIKKYDPVSNIDSWPF